MSTKYDNTNLLDQEERIDQSLEQDIIKLLDNISTQYNYISNDLRRIENSIKNGEVYKSYVDLIKNIQFNNLSIATEIGKFEEYVKDVEKYKDISLRQRELLDNDIPLKDIISRYFYKEDFKYWEFPSILKDLKDMKFILCASLIKDIVNRDEEYLQKIRKNIKELCNKASIRKIENSSIDIKELFYKYEYSLKLVDCINYIFPYEVIELYMDKNLNDEQREQIMKGVRHNLRAEEIKIYANSIGFNHDCMIEIRKGFTHGLSEGEVLLYATEEFKSNPKDMAVIRKCLEQRIPIERVKQIANMTYSANHKDEIRKAFKDRYGDDKMEILLNPDLSYEKVLLARKGFKLRFTKEQILFYIDSKFDDSISREIFNMLKLDENVWDKIKKYYRWIE